MYLNPSPLRLGIVPYLNVLPLLHGLEATFPCENWWRATPRELARLLETEAIDAAIVSVFEGLRRPEALNLIPGAAIGCDGPVRSVALFSKVPLRTIRTVLLDNASLTSTHLARILCADLMRIAPEFSISATPLEPGYDWEDAPHDAFVAIGDTALSWEHRFPYVLDLGTGWKELTGMPFVFAAWWVRAGVTLHEAEVAAFARAADGSGAALDEVLAGVPSTMVAQAGGKESLHQYLGEAIRYGLGAREISALNLYRERLIVHRLLPANTNPYVIASWIP